MTASARRSSLSPGAPSCVAAWAARPAKARRQKKSSGASANRGMRRIKFKSAVTSLKLFAEDVRRGPHCRLERLAERAAPAALRPGEAPGGALKGGAAPLNTPRAARGTEEG